MVKLLSTLAEKNNHLPNFKFGFPKGLSACDALLAVISFVQMALNSCCEMQMVGLDFHAASDHVNYEAFLFYIVFS